MTEGALISPLTGVGFLWSAAVFYLLYFQRGVALSSRPALLLVTGPLVVLTVIYVAGEVDAIRVLAGGIDPLDVHYGYRSPHIVELAEALGETGRWEYARFQLGADTLAPPAIAGFVLNVARTTVGFARVRTALVAMVSVYFLSVLLANSLMPLVMLSYPEREGLVGLLYGVVPVLDWMKYSVHGLAWLVILLSWGFALYGRVRPARA